MEPDSAREFFEAGLQSYGKAVLAVSEFKEALLAELQNAMSAQAVGSSLHLAPEPAFSALFGAPPNLLYVAAYGTLSHPASDASGEPPAAARLELGVWWTPPFPSQTGVAIYAGVSGVPWAKQIRRPDGFAGGLYKSRWAYLTRDLPKEAAFDAALAELLGHLDTACKKARTAPKE